jgi:hypothetical protein
VDFRLAEGGLVYRAGVVRERPVEKFRPVDLRQKARDWRSRG